MKKLGSADFAKKMFHTQPSGRIEESVNGCGVHFNWFSEGNILTVQVETIIGHPRNLVFHPGECFIAFKVSGDTVEEIDSKSPNGDNISFLRHAMGYSIDPPHWRTASTV